MFEITADDIALLNDVDLRSLVGRLCESEVRSRGLPTSAVTWGGNQTSSDGGLDVRVALPAGTTISGFVPKAATGFQVKKPDMPRGAILAEMRPENVLRPVIRELADESGAYIVISSTGSTSDTALKNRREAMAEAVNDLPNRSSLTLDFYDRARLATWVRDHPGLIPWVRSRVGKAVSGWRSYGPWAYEPDGASAEYLLDEKLRIHHERSDIESGFLPVDGIKLIRDLLREPGKVVRLIGLAGVGKTRLVQALFDDRIGENTLDPSLAIYTNMADDPDPQPLGLLSDLIAARTRAIVTIDNCPPDLHQRISEVCRSSESTVSVITVEYDIREDQPEGTEVFRLEPGSLELTEKLVQHRFPVLSRVDSHTIAEFSGGNARIAIALASTIGNNETIAGLSDEELFQRLFRQRHGEDESLLLVAQACSLVYSFQGQDVTSDDQAELVRLGALIGKNAQAVFRAVAELKRRDLVQQRGIWRAVLPPAIANRLAALALQNIPFASIEEQLIEGAPERLLKSFSRRLGYLHDSENAISIIDSWLAAGGRLCNVANLNNIGKAILHNVAAVAPEAVLAALERSLFGPDSDNAVASCGDCIHLIRSLAYDPALFERCAALLLKFAKGTDEDGKSNDAPTVFASLFSLYLSGTHATIEQRLRVIEPLLLSSDTNQRSVGLKALQAALEASHFTSVYNFEFGSRSRDHGYWPRSGGEVKHWYGSVLSLAETLACSDRPVAPFVSAAVAGDFRGLWNMGMFDELERVCLAISGKKFWRKGWIAVRETLKFDSERFTQEIAERLLLLERRLRPTNLIQTVRAIVLSEEPNSLVLDDLERVNSGSPLGKTVDDSDAEIARAEAIARDLGKVVATEEAVFFELRAELVSERGRRLWFFGQGLMEGTPNPKTTWDQLVAQLSATDKASQNIQVLGGFLSTLQAKNPQLADAFLDDAVQNETLAPWYPTLQTAIAIDGHGVDRLKRSLALYNTPVERYESLAWGRAADPISGQDLKELLLTIASKPNGFKPALEILGMRLYSDDLSKRGHAPEIIGAGRELLRQFKFTKKTDREDHRLEEIGKACLVGEDGAEVAREICRKLKDSVSKRETYSFNNGGLLQGLLGAQPAAVLDSLCTGGAAEIEHGIRILEEGSRHGKNLLDVVSDGDLLDWCEREPNSRYAIAAAGITWSIGAEETGARRWTHIALAVLNKARDRVAVLKAFMRRFRPMSWSGSRATIMESNAKLLDELEGYSDPALMEFVAQEKLRLSTEIETERRKEISEDKARDERFE